MITANTKTATELLAEMHALEAKLALTVCRCCGRSLTIIVQPGMRPTSTVYRYGTCYNENCRRYTITREISDLYNLTDGQVESFNQATNARRAMEAAE